MSNCWQTNPEDRPTFDDIYKQLGNVLADQNVSSIVLNYVILY